MANFIRAVLFTMLVVNLSSTNAATRPTEINHQAQDSWPYVYLDCNDCDFSYIRSEITFVNWVRDRKDAVVHVLITDQSTGSGGSAHTLDFIGLESYSGVDQNLSYVTSPNDTHDERRDGLVRILKAGLLSYMETSVLSKLSISLLSSEIQTYTSATPSKDPWDSWVFEIEASGDVEQQASRTELAVDGAFSAKRITREWRLRTWTSAEYEEDRFETADQKSKSTSHRWAFRGMLARSLGPNWSMGAFWRVYSNTYYNADLGMRCTPALEYSLWDYVEAQRRSLTFAYTVGPRAVNYVNETIFGQTAETRFDQSLDIDLKVTQPWGAMRTSLEGAHFFHDFSRYRVELYNRLSIRLFRGLSLRLSGRIERINDQISLAKGDLSVEEILLRRRQLATDYRLEFRVGLSYTFGSIYNNVVNTRL